MLKSRPQRGFTLLQLVFAIVIMAILFRVAMIKWVAPGQLTLFPQAQQMRDVIRRAQNLAMVRGQRMGVTIVNTNTTATPVIGGGVAVACVSGITPCNTDNSYGPNPKSNPNPTQDMVIGGTPSYFYFNTLGQPYDNLNQPIAASGVSVTLSYPGSTGGTRYTITVAPITGRVTLSGPTSVP